MAELPKEGWWTPEQLGLVQDRSRQWILRSFEPSDSVAFLLAGQTIARKRELGEAVSPETSVTPGGWDHEHCSLCWQKISQLPGDKGCGYTDGRDWVCRPCYERFIVPRLGKP
ncbi:MAG TPA: hypothetical protein VKY92_16795 [Verrucomicrobiae bacterium]|nr:hypothetical protein [Verrucomicrobiae bacterium]